MSSSSRWIYDARIGKEVRWSETKNSWILREDGRAIKASHLSRETTGGTSGDSSRAVNIPRPTSERQARDTSGSTGLEPDFSRLAVGSPGSTGRQVTPLYSRTTASTYGDSQPSSSRNISAVAYSATVEDETSGLRTKWEISASTVYTDPVAASKRSLNIKRVRETPSGSSKAGTGKTVKPAITYAMGRVIEVLLVPPKASNVSNITGTEEYPSDSPTRKRRFVIVSEQTEDSTGFEALAIKTYNGQGVAAPGVIKSHHAIIYTGNTIPRPETDEMPQRNAAGHLENGMQPQPIRVEQYDRTTALDPMARLDYGDKYQFDYGVPNMRVFGRVHDSSLPVLFSQYHVVWASIRSAVQGPRATDADTIDDLASNPESTTTVRPQQQRLPVATGQQRTATASSSSNAPTGEITYDQMRAILRSYRETAREHDLPMPTQQLTEAQIRGLAQNFQARTTYLNRIRGMWQQEQQRRRGDDDEEEEEEDDND